jgi:hypothetical protein
MKHVRQFADLTPQERGLLLRAVVLVAGVRLALWTVPFRWVRFVLGVKARGRLETTRVKRLDAQWRMFIPEMRLRKHNRWLAAWKD